MIFFVAKATAQRELTEFSRGIVERLTHWGNAMTYRILYSDIADTMPAATKRAASTEEFLNEHQAFGRARELLETGEHHRVAVDDGAGHVLHGMRLQLKLGGFSGD